MVVVVDTGEAGTRRRLHVLAGAVLLTEGPLDEALHAVEAAVENLHGRPEGEADEVMARRLEQVALGVSFRLK